MAVQQKTILTSTIQPLKPKMINRGLRWHLSRRAIIRIKGYPTVCDHFERKQEAQDWANDTERQIKLGKYNFAKHDQKKTIADLIDRYISDGALEHHKAAKDTSRHLEYFKSALGEYALAFLAPELLLDERKKLLETTSSQGSPRTPATVNRYFSSLSGALRYGCKNLQWIDDNPCTNLLKLKENPRKRRVLTPDEESRLLEACKSSKSPYLYCITLMALTTGARKGEILNLTWDCINFENRLACIKDSKNGRPRKIGLIDSVLKEPKEIWINRDPAKPQVFASKTLFGQIPPLVSVGRLLTAASHVMQDSDTEEDLRLLLAPGSSLEELNLNLL